ncbi:glycosyltransferase family 1 protein [bacterium]|nr:MAG: glycosyltransferase family 1 protein [bacterium]
MKLLIVTPLYPPEIGGPATYTRFLEKNLPKDQFEIEVVRFDSVKHLPYIIRHIAFFWKVFFRAKNADIVYALDPLGVGLPAGFAAKLLGKRFFLRIAGDRAWETAQQKFGITESLDTFSASRKYKLPIRLLKFGQTECSKMAEKIIVPSDYLKGIVGNWWINKEEIDKIKTEQEGLDYIKKFETRNKIVVIYNAFESVEIPESKAELREKFGMAGTVLISAGRLVVWKGMDAVIRLMPKLKKEIPDAVLYIAGDGPEKEKLECLVKELSLQNEVMFLGNIPKDELLRRVKASDIFVLNTFYEGFAHQLLEAMSVGTPVISTNVGGNPELIEDKKEGFLVDYNEESAFISAFHRTLEKGMSEQMTRNAKEKLLQFTVKRAIDSFVKECQI